ncbi:hypothetical protein J6590_021432 [Homalodisca vitripennis]|nr:hypothetical protein J6590_021432 [Homalodisca vitripennis]
MSTTRHSSGSTSETPRGPAFYTTGEQGRCNHGFDGEISLRADVRKDRYALKLHTQCQQLGTAAGRHQKHHVTQRSIQQGNKDAATT